MGSVESESLYKLIVNYLPKKFNEEDIINLFSVFGKVHSCKLMMDLKTGDSKGWCFINYFNSEDAENAVRAYNGLAMQNKVIRVSFAGEDPGNKTQVFFSGLNKNITQEELEALCKNYGRVNWCYIMPKGAALVRFESKEEALEAVAGLNGRNVPNKRYPLKVSLHESSRGRSRASYSDEFQYTGKSPSSVRSKLSLRFTPTGTDSPIVEKPPDVEVSTLYVSGLPEDFHEAKLYKMFSPYGAIVSATVVTNPVTQLCKGIAFVDMKNHGEAVSAIQSVHGIVLGGRFIKVAFKAKKS